MPDKITISFKTPDAINEACESANITDTDEINQIYEILRKFIEYSEYVNIEFDLKQGTAKVLENR